MDFKMIYAAYAEKIGKAVELLTPGMKLDALLEVVYPTDDEIDDLIESRQNTIGRL